MKQTNSKLWWRGLLGAALSFMLAASALAANRFDVVDGNLVDNSTGLVWRSLAATAGTALPATPQLGDWRVATANEVYAMFPMTGGQTLSISPGSDTYQALDFFGQTSPSLIDCEIGMRCFVGWAVDSPQLGSQTTYDLQLASFGVQPNQSGQIDFMSVSTLGSYTSAGCASRSGGLCTTGLFTVRAVPEGQSAVLMAFGLLAMGLTRRKWRR